MPKQISKYMSKIGQKGGRSGTGDAKRRDPEMCAKAGRKSAEARRLKKQQQALRDQQSQPPSGQATLGDQSDQPQSFQHPSGSDQ